jgi:hypothetical protein
MSMFRRQDDKRGQFSPAEWRMIRSYLRHGLKRFRVLPSREKPLKNYSRGVR